MEGECRLKARKGLIKVKISISRDGVIEKATISGDFFIYPEDALQELEKAIIGSHNVEEASKKLREVFRREGVEAIGSSLDDFIKTVVCAYNEAIRKH